MVKVKVILVSTFVALTLSLTAQLPSYVPTNGLISFLGFNGDADDLSGNGSSGTIFGATPTFDRDSNPNSAYLFDGVNDYIAIPSVDNFPDENITISVWCLVEGEQSSSIFSGTENFGNVVTKFKINKINGFNDGLFEFAPTTNSGIGVIDQPTNFVELDEWVHYVLVSNAREGEMKIYRNGTLLTSNLKAVDMGLILPDMSIGAGFDSSGVGSFFKGIIDDFGIWNRELSVEEIETLFEENESNPFTSIGKLNSFEVNLYPNPTNDIVNITLPQQFEGYIMLTDVMGRTVLNTSFNSDRVKLNLNNIGSRGTYFVKVVDKSGNTLLVEKLIYQ